MAGDILEIFRLSSRTYQYLPYFFIFLPVLTAFQVLSLPVPVIAFFAIWSTFAVFLSLLVIGCVEGTNPWINRTFVAILMTSIALALIYPLSLPPNIADNIPSTSATIVLANQVLSSGNLPSPSSTITYLDYPVSILLISIMKLLTNMNIAYLVKMIDVFESIFPVFVLYSLIKAKNIAIVASLIGGLSPFFVGQTTGFAGFALAASVFLPLVLLLFWRIVLHENRRDWIMIIIAVFVFVMTDVFDAFVWIVLLLAFLVSSILLSKRENIRASAQLLLFSSLFFAGWYILGTASAGILGQFSQVWQTILKPTITTTAIAPTGLKTPLLVAFEYSTFLLLIAFVVAAFAYLRSDKIPYSSIITGATIAGLVTLLPWLAGYQIGTDLAQRSELFFQLGCSIAVGVFILKHRGSRLIMVLSIILISLLVFNALSYGADNSLFTPDAPLSVNSPHLGLQQWADTGVTLCKFGPYHQIWGVAVAEPYATCAPYIYLVPLQSNPTSQYRISESDLENLSSVIGKGQVVILRESLTTIPEWPQSLPYSVDQTFRGYDVIFRSDDAFVIYT
jgi:hypothetical protein